MYRSKRLARDRPLAPLLSDDAANRHRWLRVRDLCEHYIPFLEHHGRVVQDDLRELVPRVEVEFPGFETAVVRDVRVRAGETRRTIMLQLAKLDEEVNVTREKQAAALDPLGAAFSTVLTREQIAMLPDDPDEMERVLKAMAPPGSTIRVDGFTGGKLPPKSQIRSIRLPGYDYTQPGAYFITLVTWILLPGEYVLFGVLHCIGLSIAISPLFLRFGRVNLIPGMALILLAPLGVIGFIDDNHIVGRDTDFPTFIRTLGSVMGGKGIPMVQGFVEVDRASLPKIRGLVDSIYSKLNLGLDEETIHHRVHEALRLVGIEDLAHRVPHHLIDILDLPESFDAAQFARRAHRAVAEIQARGQVPVLAAARDSISGPSGRTRRRAGRGPQTAR
jgi:hypothetical protein